MIEETTALSTTVRSEMTKELSFAEVWEKEKTFYSNMSVEIATIWSEFFVVELEIYEPQF